MGFFAYDEMVAPKGPSGCFQRSADVAESGQIAPEDPIGNIAAATGPMAYANPFRFSNKYWDDETGLGYWGYRYLNPRLGRWVSRDPIGESGFDAIQERVEPSSYLNEIALYCFARNNPVSYVDMMGLITASFSGSATESIASPATSLLVGRCGTLGITITIDADPNPGMNIAGGYKYTPPKFLGIEASLLWTGTPGLPGAACCCLGVAWQQFVWTSSFGCSGPSWARDKKAYTYATGCDGTLFDYPGLNASPFGGGSDKFKAVLTRTISSILNHNDATVDYDYTVHKVKGKWTVSYNLTANVF